ncbi:hypothetical protein SLS53_006352 [Cytospora paraplurivora]|uniref:Uncharacterized protein n=1 Tax=Cytospora paraplurivora TaxID=2898453 RepID=A0AAN9U4W1_9PEZI
MESHAFRRAATVDDTSQSRRKPSLSSFYSSDHAESPTTQRLQRRSSTLSDFSMSEARRSLRDSTDDILNPSGAKDGVAAHDSPGALAALPVAFALLPALFGVMFEGGSALATDVMLLGLVFIFLRYTITQPWQWYLSAQVARTRQEDALDLVFEDESEIDGPAKRSASIVTLDDVPEEAGQDGQGTDQTTPTRSEPEKRDTRPSGQTPSRTRLQESAINELYVHEVLALISCFVSPVVGAYLLHAIRGQLSRPSEGLLTDFNIIIFLLAAELKPLSHALKLIQSRTIHLNKIVQSVPISRSTTSQLEEMRCRLAQLEYRAEAAEEVTAQALTRETQKQQQNGGSGSKHDAALVREVRNAIQPELDALNRAVRRYEKKATVLALQTESRLGFVDTRLNDAISLAAAAAKQNNQAHWSFFALVRWVVDSLVWVALIPYDAAMFIVVWPFRTVAGLWSRKGSRKESRTGTGGSARSSRSHAGKGTRSGSGSERDRFRDRMPSRLSRRYSP